jgi:hypothetical protein
MILRMQATVQTVTANHATLSLDDGQQLTIPLRSLAASPQPGEVFVVSALPEAEASKQTEELARTLLNQLIADVPPPTQAERSDQRDA